MTGKCALILFCVYCAAAAAWAGAGTTGGNFLLIGGGARALGMGEAYVALAEDSDSVFWNPAGLAKMDFPEFLYMYNQWYVDIKHQYFNIAFPSNNGTFGGSYSLLDSGDIQGYDAGGAQTSTIKATSSDLSFAWGRRVNNRLAVGLGFKNIAETLENNQAVATALDGGLIYELNPALSFGAAIQNVGSPLKFITETTPLPQTYRLGLAWRQRLADDRLAVAVDYVNSSGSQAGVNYGLEYVLRDLLALRVGSAAGNLRAGVGVRSGNFTFDYAYLAHNYLGSAQQVSLVYDFGTADTKKALVIDRLAKGNAYFKEKKYAEASVQFAKALLLEPENAEGRAMQTKARRALEGGAVEVVEEEIKKEKEQAAAVFLNAGKKFLAEKQYLEAITEFNKALKILPSHPETVKLLREAQAGLEKEVTQTVKEEAREHFGQALKFIATEEYGNALQEVNEVLKIDPGNVEALKLYRKLNKLRQIEKK